MNTIHSKSLVEELVFNNVGPTGTDIGETGPPPDIWRYNSEIPAVAEAYFFWRKYGTVRSDHLPEEQFDAMWMHFFNNPLLDIYELRRGCNIVHDLDMIPEPSLVEQMFYACRRLNDYPMTIRYCNLKTKTMY